MTDEELKAIEARAEKATQKCNRNGQGPIGCDACDARDWLSEEEALTKVLAEVRRLQNANTDILSEGLRYGEQIESFEARITELRCAWQVAETERDALKAQLAKACELLKARSKRVVFAPADGPTGVYNSPTASRLVERGDPEIEAFLAEVK